MNQIDNVDFDPELDGVIYVFHEGYILCPAPCLHGAWQR